jgi:hypothetical protein
MLMHTRNQPNPNRPPNRLRHMPLILPRQPRLLAMLDPARRRNELGQHREILSRISTSHITPISAHRSLTR